LKPKIFYFFTFFLIFSIFLTYLRTLEAVKNRKCLPGAAFSRDQKKIAENSVEFIARDLKKTGKACILLR